MEANAVRCLDGWSATCSWSVGGALGVLFALLAFQTLLVQAARRAAIGGQAARPIGFMDLIVTADDNCYSLSRLQVYVWTVIAAVSFGAVSFASGKFAEIPPNLVLLMGVSMASSVAASAISAAKAAGPAEAKPAPNFVRDIFFDGAPTPSLDLPRAQMFAWTVIAAATYVVLLVKNFNAGTQVLPDVPIGMVGLMGISHGAYLGAKAAER